MSDQETKKGNATAQPGDGSEESQKTPWQEANFKEEIAELRKGVTIKTGFPKPQKRYRLEFEAENYNVEEMYGWLVGHAHYDWDMPVIKKVVDTHAASAASSMFGDMQARLGAQQGNVSNYMGMIGKLLKDLFALVRELRQLEERLGYYTDSYAEDSKAAHIAEATLKDTWINVVEGGSQNPSSVIGMSQRVGFVVLPDLFFHLKPLKSEEEINAEVEKLDYNEAVKLALKRKVMQFIVWKQNTYKELKNKRSFQVRYLRQHYEVIKMYMDWVKPYLKNVKRLQLNEKIMDSGMLVHSFETSASEIEVMTIRPKKDGFKQDLSDLKDDDWLSVLHFHFVFQTKPQMNFHAKESWQQKGPIHIGRVETNMRVYGWTKKQLDLYMKHKEQENWDTIASFDQSVKESLEHLGEDLERFLREAYEGATVPLPSWLKKKKATSEKKSEKKEDNTGVIQTLELFYGPIFGMWEMIKPVTGDTKAWATFFGLGGSAQASKEEEAKKAEEDSKKAAEKANMAAWQCFKNYKKSHRMVSW